MRLKNRTVGMDVRNGQHNGQRNKRRDQRKERAINALIPKPLNGEFLYPRDCYYYPYWVRDRKVRRLVLEDASYDDIVARVENATLACMSIPDHFVSQDLYLAYVPNRRIVAFAYATLDPKIRDNFSKAAYEAHVPRKVLMNLTIQRKQDAVFLSEFWSDTIAARSGIVMLYAEKYAAQGSPQHLRLLGEMTKRIQPTAGAKVAIGVSMTMPEDSGPSDVIDVTPERNLLDPPAESEVTEEPA